MKVITRVALLVVVAVAAGNYLVYSRTGQLPVKNWLANWQNGDISRQIKKVVSEPAGPAQTVSVYKWTDANGVVHYENRPVKGATLVKVSTDINVLPPPEKVDLPQAESKPETADEQVRKLQEAKRAYMDSLTQ